MSLIGKPGDALASTYKAFLDNGQGPVYIALTGLNTSDITKILENAQITYDVATTKLWNYISFPEESGLAHFFFIDYKYTRSDEPTYTSHKNGATGIESVILRGGSKTVSFLESFGLARAGDPIETPFGTGFLFSTSTGNLIVIDQERSDPNRPILTTCVKLPSGLNCY
jgi:hypothetical protein